MPLTSLSQASLQDYSECPRRFQLRYLERLIYPAVEAEPALENEKHQQEGETFHRLLQQHLLGLPAEQVGRQAVSENLQRWWGNYLHQFHFPQTPGALYPELSLSAPLASLRLLAKYDLITTQPDGNVLIYDWKTYRKRPRNEFLAARWQTRVYRALLVQAGKQLNNGQPFQPEQIEMIYWFADFPDQPAHFPYDRALYQRDQDMLQTQADAILHSAALESTSGFPQTSDTEKCAWCPYRSYCARGIQAGGGGEPAEAEASLELNFEQIGEIEL